MQGPLYRVNVLRRDADDHLLALTIHHAIADGWSLGAFVQDLCAAHLLRQAGKPEGLPPVQLSYSAWGAAERDFWKSGQIDQHIPFWRSELAEAQRLLTTPVDLHAMAMPLHRLVSHLPVNLGRAARDLARRHGVTLFTTLLAVFRIALSRWTDAQDIVVGTPVANRSKQSIRETMGYCSGVVPLRGPDRARSSILRQSSRSPSDQLIALRAIIAGDARAEIGHTLDILPSLMCALPCRITLCLMWPSLEWLSS